MPFDSFLKIAGVPGESTQAGHAGEIDVLSWSWGVTNPATGGGGGGRRTGRSVAVPIDFIKRVDTSSPLLMLACASGQHYMEAVLTCRKAGGQQQDFIHMRFTDVLVTNYQIGGSAGGDIVPTDSFSINFAKVEYSYRPQDPEGGLGKPIVRSWDFRGSRPM